MNRQDCVFCQIVAGERDQHVFYRDPLVTAFEDARRAAPVHILVVPNRHIASLNEAGPEDEALLGHLLLVAQRLAREQGIAERGYRLVINTGPDGGQSVFHLHVHLLGGRFMGVSRPTAEEHRAS